MAPLDSALHSTAVLQLYLEPVAGGVDELVDGEQAGVAVPDPRDLLITPSYSLAAGYNHISNRVVVDVPDDAAEDGLLAHQSGHVVGGGRRIQAQVPVPPRTVASLHSG